jgi:hypothetical protein
MVMVFNENGEQIPEYQGRYAEVKDKIVSDAPAGARFNHWFGYTLKPELVKVKTW